jgi:molybdopterin-guanine dinucleotide biosynthesis adapter protein
LTVPVVSIVGNSESGKTTLIGKLIPALKKRGYLVGSIKHAREINLETAKDSQHHLAAGSEMTVLATHGQIVMFKPIVEPKIEEIVQLFDSNLDLIICEGFKFTDLPKIEVYRKGNGTLIEGLTGVFAIVSDEHLNIKTRQYKTDEIESLVDLLEQGFIQPQRNWLDLYVNGKSVPLTLFPRQMISNISVAMVLTLKNIEPIQTITIRVRKETGGG